MSTTYTCETCAIRWTDADGAVCPGCKRAAAQSAGRVILPIDQGRLISAAERLITEIDRTQRSGRTLVGFPTELLAMVDELRAALGGAS